MQQTRIPYFRYQFSQNRIFFIHENLVCLLVIIPSALSALIVSSIIIRLCKKQNSSNTNIEHIEHTLPTLPRRSFREKLRHFRKNFREKIWTRENLINYTILTFSHN